MAYHRASGYVGGRRDDVAKPTRPGGAGGAAEGRNEGLRRSSVGGN